jgi:hypothetical protein
MRLAQGGSFSAVGGRSHYCSGVLAADAPSDVRTTFAAGALALFLTAGVFGAAIAWLRGNSETRRRWTRHARHTTEAQDNAQPGRVRLFAILAIGAEASCVYVAVAFRPLWWAALCSYDCALTGLWWSAVAVTGHRNQRELR